MIARFDEIFEHCGQCKVGYCDVDIEPTLFNCLLTAEPGLYIKTGGGLGCTVVTELLSLMCKFCLDLQLCVMICVE